MRRMRRGRRRRGMMSLLGWCALGYRARARVRRDDARWLSPPSFGRTTRGRLYLGMPTCGASRGLRITPCRPSHLPPTHSVSSLPPHPSAPSTSSPSLLSSRLPCPLLAINQHAIPTLRPRHLPVRLWRRYRRLRLSSQTQARTMNPSPLRPLSSNPIPNPTPLYHHRLLPPPLPLHASPRHRNPTPLYHHRLLPLIHPHLHHLPYTSHPPPPKHIPIQRLPTSSHSTPPSTRPSILRRMRRSGAGGAR